MSRPALDESGREEPIGRLLVAVRIRAHVVALGAEEQAQRGSHDVVERLLDARQADRCGNGGVVEPDHRQRAAAGGACGDQGSEPERVARADDRVGWIGQGQECSGAAGALGNAVDGAVRIAGSLLGVEPARGFPTRAALVARAGRTRPSDPGDTARARFAEVPGRIGDADATVDVDPPVPRRVRVGIPRTAERHERHLPLDEPVDARVAMDSRGEHERVDVGAVAESPDVGDLVVGVGRGEEHHSQVAGVGVHGEFVHESVEHGPRDAVAHRVDAHPDRRGLTRSQSSCRGVRPVSEAAIASSTRCRVGSRTISGLFSTFDTVWRDTWAALATSSIVGIRDTAPPLARVWSGWSHADDPNPMI